VRSGRTHTMSHRDNSSSSRRSERRARSARKQRIKINTKKEADAILAILENKARNMSEDAAQLRRIDKALGRMNKTIEEQGVKLKEKVGVANEEMRGRLGLDQELRWSDVRRMKWGADTDDEGGASTPRSDSNPASSIEPTTPTKKTAAGSTRDRSDKEVMVVKKSPAVLHYDEAIRKLEAVSAELKQIASAPMPGSALKVNGDAVKELAARLKEARDELKQ
ncbi:hypothetical protein PFISCL1PPCAC_17418, partial [Pristionchus fissidentatus]